MNNRVLIVEDDHATQELLVAVLEREAIESDQAGDGEVALRKLAGDEFAAVLLDLIMPRCDGFAVLRDLALRQPQMVARTLVITAAADSTWAGRPELRQVRCVLRKPLDLAELLAELRGCMAATASPRA